MASKGNKQKNKEKRGRSCNTALDAIEECGSLLRWLSIQLDYFETAEQYERDIEFLYLKEKTPALQKKYTNAKEFKQLRYGILMRCVKDIHKLDQLIAQSPEDERMISYMIDSQGWRGSTISYYDSQDEDEGAVQISVPAGDNAVESTPTLAPADSVAQKKSVATPTLAAADSVAQKNDNAVMSTPTPAPPAPADSVAHKNDNAVESTPTPAPPAPADLVAHKKTGFFKAGTIVDSAQQSGKFLADLSTSLQALKEAELNEQKIEIALRKKEQQRFTDIIKRNEEIILKREELKKEHFKAQEITSSLRQEVDRCVQKINDLEHVVLHTDEEKRLIKYLRNHESWKGSSNNHKRLVNTTTEATEAA